MGCTSCRPAAWWDVSYDKLDVQATTFKECKTSSSAGVCAIKMPANQMPTANRPLREMAVQNLTIVLAATLCGI